MGFTHASPPNTSSHKDLSVSEFWLLASTHRHGGVSVLGFFSDVRNPVLTGLGIAVTSNIRHQLTEFAVKTLPCLVKP